MDGRRRLEGIVVAACGLAMAACGSSSGGTIDFGTGYHGDAIRGQRTAFGPGSTVAWVAHFSSAAGSKHLNLQFVGADAACPDGRTLATVRLPLRSGSVKEHEYRVVAADLPLAGVPVPGRYTLRYSAGGKILANGEFSLKGPPRASIQFGATFRRLPDGTLAIEGRKSQFASGALVAWVAHFNEQAGARKISFELDRIHGCGQTRLFRDDHIHVQSVRATAYATRVTMQDLQAIGANSPGWYMMAYYHGHRLLARGEVHLRG